MENTLQSQCFIWHWNSFPEDRQMLFHINNKAKNKIEGNKFKAMGVVKGVSDLIYITHGAVHFIELKEPGRSQSNEQTNFMTKVIKRGHYYHLLYNFDNFKTLILNIRAKKK